MAEGKPFWPALKVYLYFDSQATMHLCIVEMADRKLSTVPPDAESIAGGQAGSHQPTAIPPLYAPKNNPFVIARL